jgi:hypothetical protein
MTAADNKPLPHVPLLLQMRRRHQRTAHQKWM